MSCCVNILLTVHRYLIDADLKTDTHLLNCERCFVNKKIDFTKPEIRLVILSFLGVGISWEFKCETRSLNQWDYVNCYILEGLHIFPFFRDFLKYLRSVAIIICSGFRKLFSVLLARIVLTPVVHCKIQCYDIFVKMFW